MSGGKLIALKAQLDCVAEALGEPRMTEADGYHYEAIKEVMGELRAYIKRYQKLDRILDSLCCCSDVHAYCVPCDISAQMINGERNE